MSRYIKESEMLEVIDKWQESLSPRIDLRDGIIFDTLESVNFHIDDLATADVVEVVRCKDCKYKIKNAFGLGIICDKVGAYMPSDNSYCSYGKKVE